MVGRYKKSAACRQYLYVLLFCCHAAFQKHYTSKVPFIARHAFCYCDESIACHP